ncbi:hypothetical protein ACIQCR_20695 [Streptomyces sp. NPDC093249]|uniref:hypothetical protein n=1 Tax=unclassified Streptomyces TaxID=2593676 RepID=UPI00345091F3
MTAVRSWHSDDRDTPPDEPEKDSAERELRVLLDRATPYLPTPADRLGQVRERIRRRRRRAAGGAVLGGAVLALTATLLPRAVLTEDVVAGPAVTAAPATPARPTDKVTTTTLYAEELAGLVLKVPRGWHTLLLPGVPDSGVRPEGYVSTAPLRKPPRPCQKSTRCDPAEQLSPDDLIVEFVRYRSDGYSAAELRDGRKLAPDENLGRGCSGQDRATAYTGTLPGSPEPRTAIEVLLCAGDDVPEQTLKEALTMVEEATFRQPDHPPNPPEKKNGTER